MRRLLAVQTHLALRFVIFLMISAGLAALVAVVFVIRPPTDWSEWIRPIRDTALSIGFSFLGAGVIALTLLPARRDVVSSAASSADDDPAAAIPLLAAGLAIAAVLQVPTLLAWWNESARLIDQLAAGERDPLGLWIIPAALVIAPLFIAALIVLLFVEAAIGVVAARPPVAARLLRTGVVLQIGLVVGSTLALPPIQDLIARLVALAAADPDATVAATIRDAVTPQNVFASTLLFRFQLMLCGSVFTALASRQAPREAPAPPATPLRTAPVAAPVAAPAASVESSALAGVFTASEYRVRLRTHWLIAAFRLGDLDYAITPVAAGGIDPGFSFSGNGGRLRRASDNRSLLTVQPQGRRWSLKASHVVCEPSGNIVGILEPDGSDWNVLDPSRRLIAQVQRVETRKGYVGYCMRDSQGEDVCRFTWAMRGLGAWTAEMDVEFLGAGAGRIDPVYAVALAPILEAKARRTSQWLS